MTLKTKKVIAREFIFFLCSLLVSTVAYLSVSLYNNYQAKKSLQLTSEISHKAFICDSLTKPYLDKIYSEAKILEYIKGVYSNLEDAYGKSGTVQKGALMTSFDSFPKKLQDSSYIRTVYTNLDIAYGKDNMPDFETFQIKIGRKNKITLTEEQIKNYKSSSKLNDEIQILKTEKQETDKIIDEKKNSTYVSQVFFIFSLAILFVLRYLFYATKWSLKILKQK